MTQVEQMHFNDSIDRMHVNSFFEKNEIIKWQVIGDYEDKTLEIVVEYKGKLIHADV